jgi:hypothetical protein
MDDEDTARSGFVDQDLPGVSELNVPSRDSIDWFDPDEADVSISVKGEIFKLSDFTLQQLQESALLATKYMVILCGSTAFQNKSGRELSSHLSELTASFSRFAAEAAALNNAANYEIPDALLDAMLPSCGNSDPFLMLIDYHNDKQKESGLNVDRIDAQHE